MNSRRNFKGLVSLVLVFCFMAAFIPKKTLAHEDDRRNKIGETFRFKDTEELCTITEYDLSFKITKKAQDGRSGEVSVAKLLSFKDSKIPIKLPKYVTHVKTKCSYYITEIGNEAFSHEKIDEIILHNKITEIGENAFQGSKIKTITIPSSVRQIGFGAFSFCYYLKEVIIDDGNPNYCSKDNRFLLSKNGKTLFATANMGDVITIPYGIQKIEQCALSSNIFLDEGTYNKYTRLKKITIPSSVKKIYANNLNSSIIVFKGKNIPEIYDNDLNIDLLVVTKDNLNKLKDMQFDGENVFCDNVLVNTKIPYKSANQKFLEKLNPEDYKKNQVKYKSISKFSKNFLATLKKKNPDITDKEIAFEVFNYIRKNYELDSWYMHEEFNNKSSRTSEFLFKNKIGYVNSFTALAQYILREIGIPCATVSYTTNRNPDIHDTEITSAVYIDNKWVLIDFCLGKPFYFDYIENFSNKTKLTKTYLLN